MLTIIVLRGELFVETGKSKNVFLLMLSQAFFLASSMTIVSFTGLVGLDLSPNPAYATLAMSLVVAATALSTAPMSLIMQKKSRRFGFRLGAVFGIVGGLTSAASILLGSFSLLCLGGVLMGPFQSSAQYYRFAAAESVPARQSPWAISLVLVGGLVAAVLTPTATSYLNSLFDDQMYMGAFLFVAMMAAAVLIPLSFFKPLEKSAIDDVAEVNEPVRPLGEIARTPKFIIAALNAALGYAMMAFVMTATPLAIQACSYGPDVSSRVIQAHVIAMFLPSLFTGHLISKFGVVPVLLAGHAMFAAAFVTALSGIQIWQFSVALIALGVGWNFCFVGGSALLTQVHTDSEKGKVQGLNEFLVFGMSALASFMAGLILNAYGWVLVNQAAFIMLVIAAAATSLWGVLELNKRRAK